MQALEHRCSQDCEANTLRRIRQNRLCSPCARIPPKVMPIDFKDRITRKHWFAKQQAIFTDPCDAEGVIHNYQVDPDILRPIRLGDSYGHWFQSRPSSRRTRRHCCEVGTTLSQYMRRIATETVDWLHRRQSSINRVRGSDLFDSHQHTSVRIPRFSSNAFCAVRQKAFHTSYWDILCLCFGQISKSLIFNFNTFLTVPE